MGGELGSATDIDRLVVSSQLSKLIFTLIGNDDCWSCHTNLKPNMSAKNNPFSFLGYLGESSRIRKRFGPTYALLYHRQCFQFPSINLQWLTSFDFKNIYPFFGWPNS